jgi:hypothetical protein
MKCADRFIGHARLFNTSKVGGIQGRHIFREVAADISTKLNGGYDWSVASPSLLQIREPEGSYQPRHQATKLYAPMANFLYRHPAILWTD